MKLLYGGVGNSMEIRIKVQYYSASGLSFYKPQIKRFGLYWVTIGPGTYFKSGAMDTLDKYLEERHKKPVMKTRIRCVYDENYEHILFIPQVSRFGIFWKNLYWFGFKDISFAEEKLKRYIDKRWDV